MNTTLQVTAIGECELCLTRTFAAARTVVFDCFTRPELVQRWLTGPEGWSFALCEIDLRVGGAFRFVWHKVDGTVMGMGGVYHAVDSPAHLVNTELFDEDWTGGATLCTYDFVETEGRTTVINTVRYVSREMRDAVLTSGMTDGVAVSYDRLDRLLTAMAT